MQAEQVHNKVTDFIKDLYKHEVHIFNGTLDMTKDIQPLIKEVEDNIGSPLEFN